MKDKLIEELCKEILELSQIITDLRVWKIIDKSMIVKGLDGDFYLKYYGK